MSKRLYLATASIQIDMVVEADSLAEAQKVASANALEAIESVEPDVDAAVFANTAIPERCLDTLPWGGDGRLTVREILAKQRAKTDPSELAPEAS